MTLKVPSSVAIVGASAEGASRYGSRMLANVLSTGPAARIYAVNPRYAGSTLQGVPVFGSLSELPEVVDLAALATPVTVVPQVLDEAGGLGVATCAVLGAHHGDEEQRRQFDRMVGEIGQRYGMRILGPNSLGLLNGTSRLNVSFTSAMDELRPGNIAALAQSGAFISYLLQYLCKRDVGYSWLISTGNEAGVTIETLLDELVEDDETKVILLFLEGVRDGAAFRRALLRARQAQKPVIVLSVGQTESGRQSVMSHTGRIATGSVVMTAVCEEAGAFQASSYAELYDLATSFAYRAARRPPGHVHRRRAVVVTTSGGAGTYAADQLSLRGWTLPPVSASTREAMKEVFDQGTVGNPVDVAGTFFMTSRLGDVTATLAAERNIDAVVVATGNGGRAGPAVAASLAASLRGLATDAFVGWVGMQPDVQAVFDGAGVVAYDDIGKAVAAAEAAAAFAQHTANAPSETTALLQHLASRTTHGASAGAGEWHAVGSAQLLSELQAIGVPCAAMAVTRSLDGGEAVELASRLGFPVVAKLDSPSLTHKSDVGAVALDLRNSRDVVDAVERFQSLAVRAKMEGPRVLIQRMVKGAEVLVGMRHDETFGLSMIVGLGGILAELFPHVAATVLPTTRSNLRRMVERNSALAAILAGYRGGVRTELELFVGLLQSLSEWALTRPAPVREADFNPVVLTNEGPIVVDARLAAYERKA